MTQVISMELCNRPGIPSEPSLKERSDAQKCVNRGVRPVRFSTTEGSKKIHRAEQEVATDKAT